MSRASHDKSWATAWTTGGNGRGLGPGVEYEFQKLTLPRELSRNVVARMLIDCAERGGWELDRHLLFPDGTRKVTMRRKIIRQTRPTYLSS